MKLELDVPHSIVDSLDNYVHAANDILGYDAYTRETAARAVLQDWTRARQANPLPRDERRWTPPNHRLGV